ncbi:Polysaccharide biosynthesis protein [Jatrophihabitans endophyticus]|uniref:Polysaccharide biosynthesis protein n=1 Tax=Jatrophihabitans endophyticus TaxID=1206085 RepID=A0A1M5ILW8_9ACTN|nr:polysaccharide biosynthesis protein [Jatrophihabitans endophyticus]SHG28920.1 Polysaccharide biosynthesis protein [Jatrophihabitans endophyticus]
MSAVVRKIVEEMTEVVPPGQARLDYRSREHLHRLTTLLVDADATAEAEYERYLAIADRGLDTAPVHDRLVAAYGGQRVLVTGGTGCIGSVLSRELLAFEPAEVFCIYTTHDDFVPVPGVVYVDVDIRDEAAVRDVVGRMRPDVVFHCAAQRSPGLAEREVARTLQANVVGTRNVLRAARDVDVRRFVHASTGKAMRYYTTDVYAASKKVAEWLVADYGAEGRATGMARFTHVVDNAVVLENVENALARPDGVIRVHDPDLEFYAQSARESAQLLLLAGLDAATDRPHGLAIRSLGEPARLLDVVVGKIKASPRGDEAAIYLSGYDKGYERGNPPGLYDPENATELSPLVNAIEAATAVPHDAADNVDRFEIALPPSGGDVDALVDAIDHACAVGDPLDASAELARAAKQVADAMFHRCPDPLFTRIHAMAARADVALPTTRRPAA